MDISLFHTTAVTVKEEYKGFVERIKKELPVLLKESEVFYKSHSQFMNVTLDITDLTPLRTVKRILAEINKTKDALQENYYRLKKQELEIKQKEQLLETTEGLDREILLIEIEEKRAGMQSAIGYIQSALRKVNYLMNQRALLMKQHNIEQITEEQYEKEEIKYHIMTALKQALCAARVRNGVIDEGNMLYFFELGINGAHVQFEMFRYLEAEKKMLEEGKAPTIGFTLNWMQQCAELWKDCPAAFAKERGLAIFDPTSLHQPELIGGNNVSSN